MLNRACLNGRLTAAPDLRYTPSNKAVLTGTVAVNRNFKSQSGDYEADFINFVVWGQSAEYLATNAGKGTLISLDGRIQTRNYENQQGQRVYVTEIVAEQVNILERREQQQQRQSESNYLGATEISDADLPF